MSVRIVRWEWVHGGGLEHLHLQIGGSAIEARGVMLGTLDARRFALTYRILCDPGWVVREAEVETIGEGRHAVLTFDGAGTWRDGRGQTLDVLSGCGDLDLMGSPFTNTLPINRLQLGPEDSRRIRTAYITVPDLTLRADMQRYTCLESGRRYRYEGLDTKFTAELTIDADGLVVEYEGLFRRV